MSEEHAEQAAASAGSETTRQGCLMGLLAPRKGKWHWALLRLAVVITLVVVFRYHVLACFAAGHNFLWKTYTGSTENHPKDIGLLLRLRGPGASMLVRLGEEAALSDAPESMAPTLANYATAHARPEVRAYALEGLGKFDDPRARAAATTALSDGEPKVRLAAAHVLRETGTRDDVPILEYALMKEKNDEVKRTLRRTILTLSRPIPPWEKQKQPTPRGR